MSIRPIIIVFVLTFIGVSINGGWILSLEDLSGVGQWIYIYGSLVGAAVIVIIFVGVGLDYNPDMPLTSRFGLGALFVLFTAFFVDASGNLVLVLDFAIAESDLILPPGEHDGAQASLMVVDQILKGLLFDALEVYDISLTPLRPNPEVIWFASIFATLRVLVSIYIVALILKLFGFSRSS